MRIFLVFAIIAVFAFTQAFSKNTPTPPTPIEITNEAATTNSEVSTVSKVIDGDTIELVDGRRVRFVGVDSPEIQDSQFKIQEECFAKEAKEEVVRLVSQKTVRLEKDVSEADKYGRLLRYVYIDSFFLDDYLVRQGFARVMGIPPDTKFYGQLKEAEKEAKAQKRGMWSACSS